MLYQLFTVLFSLVIISSLAISQEAPDMEKMMKLWEDMATPGDAHKKLDLFTGTWETSSKIWMGPGEPMVTKGSATISWALNGLFQKQEYSGEMMGKPMNGIGYTGYDIYNKKYIAFWIDNSSSAFFSMEGTFDPSGKVLSLYGKMDDFMTGEHGKNIAYVMRIVDNDKFIFEMHDLAMGVENNLTGEITYTRKK